MTRDIIKEFLDHVTNTVDPLDLEQMYRDYLRELYDFAEVGGPFQHMDPAAVLEEMDPTAFRCGCADMACGHEDYEIDGENYDRRAVDRAAEEFIDALECELTDMEEELAALEAEDCTEEKEDEIKDKEAEILACKRYTF